MKQITVSQLSDSDSYGLPVGPISQADCRYNYMNCLLQFCVTDVVICSNPSDNDEIDCRSFEEVSSLYKPWYVSQVTFIH